MSDHVQIDRSTIPVDETYVVHVFQAARAGSSNELVCSYGPFPKGAAQAFAEQQNRVTSDGRVITGAWQRLIPVHNVSMSDHAL